MTSNTAKLLWWKDQAAELLTTPVEAVKVGSRTHLTPNKGAHGNVLTVSHLDLEEFTNTDAGQWVITRLNEDPNNRTLDGAIHLAIAAGLLLTALTGMSQLSTEPGTGIFVILAAIVGGIAQWLYLRNQFHSQAVTTLHADRIATDRLGKRTAVHYFDAADDKLYRTPIHTLLAKTYPASLANRAQHLGIETREPAG